MRVHQEAEVDGRQLLDRWLERGLIQPDALATAAGSAAGLLPHGEGALGGLAIWGFRRSTASLAHNGDALLPRCACGAGL
jgi:hypothetical protein